MALLYRACVIAFILISPVSVEAQLLVNPTDIEGLKPVPDTLKPVVIDPASYRIENGYVSEEMLHRYFKRALAMQVADRAPYKSYCGQENTGEEFACWMEFARYVRPKYVQFAGLELDNCWKLNGVCDHLFFPADEGAVGQFKKAIDILHTTVDSQIICEASIIEFMPKQYRKGASELKIPGWVKTALPELPELRNETIFDRDKMLFPHTGEEEEVAIFIDITRPVSLAWYYYLATMYIDFGYEALKFCQINRTSENDRIPKVPVSKNLYWTDYLFTKLRNYAKQKGRRGFVLINSQTQGQYKGDPANKELLLDFHVGPTGIQAVDTTESMTGFLKPGTSPAGGQLARGNGLSGGTDYEALIALHTRDLLLYNTSLGGKHPMGWQTSHNPFLAELDCFGGYVGGTNPPLRDPNGWQAWAPWYWDESTWLFRQSAAYRRQFMVYAYHRVKCLDDAGHIQFAANRPYRTGPGAPYYWYRAYNCDDGFKDAAIIKNLWDGNENSLPKTHKYYNRWANSFAPAYYFDSLQVPKGKCYFDDFNGDRYPDILEIADPEKGQRWKGWKMYLLKDNAYTYHKADTDATGDKCYIGDFDGDGYEDLLLMGDGWKLYTYQSAYKPAAGGNLRTANDRIYVGDFNGDGKDDLLGTADTSGGWEGYKIFTSAGDGFRDTLYQEELSWKEQLYIGDFNGDGKDDVLATADKHAGEALWEGYKVFHSTGSGFEQKAYGKWPSWTERIVVHDWNNDGYADFTAMTNGEPGYNWFGSKTYLGNDEGNHFIFAFDFNDLGLTPGYTGYDQTRFIPFAGPEPYLVRYTPLAGYEDIQLHHVLHCDGGKKDSTR